MLKHLWILFLVRYGCLASYFCNLRCGRKHTVCQRKPCGPGYKCGTNYMMLQLDDESRQWAVNAHNEFRNRISLGQDTTGGNGKAANMHVVSYSKEIEFVAQCWANACGSSGSHDACRSTSQFRSVGQNMFAIGGAGKWNFSQQKWMLDGMNYWYSEIKNMDGYVIDKFQSNGKMIGHFTQLLWAKTTHIGCGRTQYGSGKGHSMLLYCNYGVGGNSLGEPVYERGNPCSNCGSESCNKEYSGLCGQIRPIKNDRWTPPFELDSSGLQNSVNNIKIILIAGLVLI